MHLDVIEVLNKHNMKLFIETRWFGFRTPLFHLFDVKRDSAVATDTDPYYLVALGFALQVSD